jgi:hypothetical protein
VRVKELNESEPFDDVSKRIKIHQKQGSAAPCDDYKIEFLNGMLIGCTAFGTSRKPSGKAARLLLRLESGTGEPNALKRGQETRMYGTDERTVESHKCCFFFFF